MPKFVSSLLVSLLVATSASLAWGADGGPSERTKNDPDKLMKWCYRHVILKYGTRTADGKVHLDGKVAGSMISDCTTSKGQRF